MGEAKQNRIVGFRIVLNILRVFLIVFIMDFVIGFALQKMYQKQKSGLESSTSYTIDSMEEEVIVFGSSRANHHYVPEIIEDSLNLSCFNAGRDGQYMFYYEALITSALERYSPKIIILELNALELLHSQDSYDRIAALLPYYNRNNSIKDLVHLKSPFEKFKLFSKIYPYNGSFLSIVQNILVSKESDTGYKPIFRTMESPKMDTMHIKDREFDPNQIESLKRITAQCNDKGVSLVVVTSPALMVGDDKVKNNRLIELSEELNLIYYDYAYSPYFLENMQSFADPLHLNDEGARMFTKKLVRKIKQEKRILF